MVYSLSVSGTPCTGKTTNSRKLSSLLKAVYLDLNDYAKSSIGVDYDKDHETFDVDVDELGVLFEKEYGSGKEPLVVDGLLSHFMPVSHVLVLRADPRLLSARMSERGYGRGKILENLEAEYAGVILYDALSLHNNVLELDATTGVDYDVVSSWLESGGRKVFEKDWSTEFTEALNAL
ncbi:MAG: AAA family ATPase [Candidatus Altiarchaeota archaeon]